jgi:pimeloyl-ACP methyl ester carboxylesterase
MLARTGEFEFDGHRLVYDDYGKGNRVVVLLPGLLFSRKMHGPLASALAEKGNRVLLLDLLGHGDSDRPPEMWNYSMTIFAQQTVGLLDVLDVDQAVIGGTSLGANVALETGVAAPERAKGLLIEMPVLDNALLACALAFTPLLVALTFGAPVARALAAGARRVPRGSFLLADMGLDWVSQDPKPSASVLQGLFFGRVAPPTLERRGLEQPTLVIGHDRDPIHPFEDSDMLVREVTNARLVRARSILELRLSPERLTTEIVRFVERCFRPGGRREAGRRHPAARRPGSVPRRRSA